MVQQCGGEAERCGGAELWSCRAVLRRQRWWGAVVVWCCALLVFRDVLW